MNVTFQGEAFHESTVAALQATQRGTRLAPADWRQKQPLLLPVDEKAQQEANWFCRSEG